MSQYLHKCAETIQERKLFKGRNYMRKYSNQFKGQLVSKRNSQAEDSPKKRTTSMRRVFVRFLGDYLTFKPRLDFGFQYVIKQARLWLSQLGGDKYF